ncbi:hypothetical protein L0B53_00995 [Vibrio sp. SS-MA-C1-2]|uniref:hypothetical protein n=1 Tax=Vibrio sp. SS-MA-C1-2 TaxID=2908646 RepID=UPI001F37A241|nr:hypothetical protein [Vibrio sp. SS-MA-C1-2]UJF17384.1 hypothetical protein L0B53_00995 [Vibrio sp. SS-MA-C1-2]
MSLNSHKNTVVAASLVFLFSSYNVNAAIDIVTNDKSTSSVLVKSNSENANSIALDGLSSGSIIKLENPECSEGHALYNIFMDEMKDNQTFNLSPLTNLVITKITGVSPQMAYQYQDEYRDLFTPIAIQQAEKEIKQLLVPLDTNSTLDLDSLSFVNANNNQRLNQLLTQLDFEFNADQAIIHDKESGNELILPYFGDWSQLAFS